MLQATNSGQSDQEGRTETFSADNISELTIGSWKDLERQLACEFHVVINERRKVQFLKSFCVCLAVHQIFQNFENLYIVLHTFT